MHLAEQSGQTIWRARYFIILTIKKSRLQGPLIMTCIAMYIQIFHWRKPKSLLQAFWNKNWRKTIWWMGSPYHYFWGVKFSRKGQLTLSEHLSNNDSITQHRQQYTQLFIQSFTLDLSYGFISRISDSLRMQSIWKQQKRKLNTGSYCDTWEGENAECNDSGPFGSLVWHAVKETHTRLSEDGRHFYMESWS